MPNIPPESSGQVNIKLIFPKSPHTFVNDYKEFLKNFLHRSLYEFTMIYDLIFDLFLVKKVYFSDITIPVYICRPFVQQKGEKIHII